MSLRKFRRKAARDHAHTPPDPAAAIPTSPKHGAYDLFGMHHRWEYLYDPVYQASTNENRQMKTRGINEAVTRYEQGWIVELVWQKAAGMLHLESGLYQVTQKGFRLLDLFWRDGALESARRVRLQPIAAKLITFEDIAGRPMAQRPELYIAINEPESIARAVLEIQQHRDLYDLPEDMGLQPLS